MPHVPIPQYWDLCKAKQRGSDGNMSEEEIKTEEEEKTEDEFFGYNEDQNEELIKLEVGEYVKGLLMAKDISEKYSCGIYKIKEKDTGTTKVLLGSTILDRKMAFHFEGEEIIIERVANSLNQKQQTMHNFKIYTKGDVSEKKKDDTLEI